MTQQNPNPQAEEVGTSRGKNKRPRPYWIETRHQIFWSKEEPKPWTEWRVHGRYRTEQEMMQTLENMQRKYSRFRWEYRRGGES